MALLHQKTASQHQQGAGGAGGKAKAALHELKDFIFSPMGIAFTLGLILLVHHLSTKEESKK